MARSRYTQPESLPTQPESMPELRGVLHGLMRYYWTPEDSLGSRDTIISDLLEDTIEFDLGVVRAACAEWRREHEERPKPSQLRRGCIEEITRRSDKAQAEAAKRRPQQSDPRIEALRDEQRARRRAADDAAELARQQMARELGYPNFGYMLSIGLVHAVNSAQGRNLGGRAPTAADMGVTATESGKTIRERAQ